MNDAEPPSRIEDYALIGDCISSALVGRNGSIDWLCWPRFDSAACFAALLGDSSHGRWKIAPQAMEGVRVERGYRDGSLVLETRFVTAEAEVALIDFMPWGLEDSAVVRIVEARRGAMKLRMELVLRFDYGASVPWVEHLPDADGNKDAHGIVAIAGPEMAVLRAEVPVHGEDMHTVADFMIEAGRSAAFVLAHRPSHLPPPAAIDARAALRDTEAYWRDWSSHCHYEGPYRDAVLRSLLTLKALTYRVTGGIVAAPTTSLPEQLGGSRNWDYRFCWLRDATLTLFALMNAGYFEEAGAWRDWLHRSIAGSPSQIQIMYGLAGERQLSEWEAAWLPGYEGSKPVRIGNAAAGQLQLDVYGEVINALHQARGGGLAIPEASWDLQRAMLRHLETIWHEPDEGIWEVRGARRHFTFSKVMCWVAFDRTVSDMEKYGLEGPLEHWRALRDEIHARVCAEGFDARQNSFVQYFGGEALDASLLIIPLVGFLPADDPRMLGTVAATERKLLSDGFVLRYQTDAALDGLPPGEGAFLACSFWLASNYQLQGRLLEARSLFERLLALRNDLGLLAEEYDPKARRQVGNFPQAFSHVALVGAALRMQGEHPTERNAAEQSADHGAEEQEAPT